MRYLLAIIPDEIANHRIRKVIAQAGSLFDSYDIAVKLVKPEKLYVPILELGSKLSPIRKYFLLKKLRKEIVLKFSLKIDKIKLGSSSRHRELVSLSLGDGSEDLRKIVYKLEKSLKIKRSNRFLPNITLGRVTKEIINEEYRNLSTAISQLNKEIGNDLNKIEWVVNKLEIIEIWPECAISIGEVEL